MDLLKKSANGSLGTYGHAYACWMLICLVSKQRDKQSIAKEDRPSKLQSLPVPTHGCP